MHSVKSILFALTVLVIGATAQNVTVVNECGFDIYILSTPVNGGASTSVQTLATGTNYTQVYGSGSAVKVGNTTDVSNPLTVEYTPNDTNGLVYYDLSNNAGNPFSDYGNALVPSNSSCFAFNCAGGADGAACYSNGNNIQVKACTFTDLTTTICTAS